MIAGDDPVHRDDLFYSVYPTRAHPSTARRLEGEHAQMPLLLNLNNNLKE